MGKPTYDDKQDIQDAGPTPPASVPDQAAAGPLAAVQEMVMLGRAPAEVAAVIQMNPSARAEIYRYLQTTVGNSYVQQVIAAAQQKCSEPGLDLPKPPVLLADAPPPAKPASDMVAMVVNVDGQNVQVYVSPGGIDKNPDVAARCRRSRARTAISRSSSTTSWPWSARTSARPAR